MTHFFRIFLIICSIFFINIQGTFAISVQLDSSQNVLFLEKTRENIQTQEIFGFYADLLSNKVPDSYKYINVKFKNLTKGTELEDALKKLVYLDAIKNVAVPISYTKPMPVKDFYKLSSRVLNIDISTIKINAITERNVNSNDLSIIKRIYTGESYTKKNRLSQKAIFDDVYSTIKNDFYEKDTVSDKKLIYSAIEGLAGGTEDKHTVYFPPTKNKIFQEALDGDFEGIGAYVELRAPGEFYIVSPITGSPAQASGIKAGDRVLQIDKQDITKDLSQKDIISLIKGKPGTKVILTIQRGDNIFAVTITRQKIHISNVNGELKGKRTYYIQITTFGEEVDNEFITQLKTIKDNPNIEKVVIDLRNNGGGYLDKVVRILSYLIPKGETTTIVDYLDGEKRTYSLGYEGIKVNNYNIVLLINGGTASASEIFVGTLKDYFPKITILGEKSYGKGSVQSIKQYYDGSSFKYTIAKWFTGKTKTGIDGVGITPDIILPFDSEKYKDQKKDNQLEKALEL